MPIIINTQTDKFFISISKYKAHSFLMLGVYDQNKVQHLLCRVGKFHEPADNESQCLLGIKFLYDVLFYKAKARLVDERIIRRKKGSQPITYQAYDITYTQYFEFVKILESLQTRKNKFLCYKPVAINGTEITLELSNELFFRRSLQNKTTENLIEHVNELHVGNTCRHSAMALVEATLRVPVTSSVSSHFFINLPYKTVLEYGKPSENILFYVLPAPPTTFSGLEKTKIKIIEKLYQRMEHLLLLETNAQSTQDKFLRLKELYLTLIGPKKESSLAELLQSIHTWKQENESIIATLRKKYFWDSFFSRKSATMCLIEEVERDLQVAQKPGCF